MIEKISSTYIKAKQKANSSNEPKLKKSIDIATNRPGCSENQSLKMATAYRISTNQTAERSKRNF